MNKVMTYSKQELEDAKLAVNSTLSKCEKSLQNIKNNSPQKTLLIRRIKALKISADLIDRELIELKIDREQ